MLSQLLVVLWIIEQNPNHGAEQGRRRESEYSFDLGTRRELALLRLGHVFAGKNTFPGSQKVDGHFVFGLLVKYLHPAIAVKSQNLGFPRLFEKASEKKNKNLITGSTLTSNRIQKLTFSRLEPHSSRQRWSLC